MVLDVQSFLSPAKIFDTIFDEEASFTDLLQLTLVLAFLVFLCFSAAHPILLYLVQGALKPCFWAVCEREYNQPSRLKELKHYGIAISNKQEYFDRAILRFWPNMMMIYTQHAISGMLAIPAVFGSFYSNYFPITKQDASSLACLGILLEIGWEVQDIARILYYRTWKGDKQMFPTKLVVFKCIHHMTALIGIPLILSFRDMPELHRVTFELQFTSVVYGFCDEYSRTLDTTKLVKLVESTFYWWVTATAFAWIRMFDFFYLMGTFLELFYSKEMWMQFSLCLVPTFIFSVFNILATAISFQRAIELSKKLLCAMKSRHLKKM